MSQSITQIQVFVSCPGDVEQEKQVVKDVCESLNESLLQGGGTIQFKVREWRAIIGHYGPRSQSIINETITNYDIYLGILWNRFGTPPGAVNPETGESFQSGTEEEFYLAFNHWKKNSEAIRLYFFFKESSSETNTTAAEQVAKVNQFRKQIGSQGWINTFPNVEEFKKKINQLLTTIAFQDSLQKKKEIKKEQLAHYQSYLAYATQQITPVSHYIPRTVRPVSEETTPEQELLFPRTYPSLSDIILQQQRIVVLGNAGSGKSIELQQLFLKFAEASSPFLPVYKRFNTYTGQEIDAFLPHGWQDINPEILLLVLDGLDEIQPSVFSQAIRKILDFVSRYPQVHLVISCRTNFYDFPSRSFGGTLPGFEVYRLTDITMNQVREYLDQSDHTTVDEFINACHRHGYLDMMTKPFFLTILVEHFFKQGSLKEKRIEMIRDFLYSRIKLDEAHFYTTVDTAEMKRDIVSRLQRVALSMEIMGRNYINTSELQAIVDSDEKRRALQYFSAFSKMTEKPDHWQFEHNNIQEYLAASSLAQYPVEKIKQLVAFPPEFKKIKPTWINTLSFLMSLLEGTEKIELVNWVYTLEPEIMVKFEKDRISASLRSQVLLQIFNDYKQKGVWLNSNKFTDHELAEFCHSPEVADFLITELAEEKNSRVVRLNALHLLDNINLSQHYPSQFTRLRQLFFVLFGQVAGDTGMIYSILRAMASLGMNERNTIEQVLSLFRHRYNQYIRSGMYKLILSADRVDEYIDVFLEGLVFADEVEAKKDRESINLADESMLLREGLTAVSSLDALKKVLGYFNYLTSKGRHYLYNRPDILRALVKKAIVHYTEEKGLFQIMLNLYMTLGQRHEKDSTHELQVFFSRTGTAPAAYQQIVDHPDLSSYVKEELSAALIDELVIDDRIAVFIQDAASQEELIRLYNHLGWYVFGDRQKELQDYLEDQLRVRAHTSLQKPVYENYADAARKNRQTGFDILFNPNQLIAEFTRLFNEIGLDELKFENLWEFRKNNNELLDDYFAESVLRIVREFARDGKTVTLLQLTNWVASGASFTDFQIENMQYQLAYTEGIQVSAAQQQFIENWCKQVAAELKETSIARQDTTTGYISINSFAEILWFFITKLKIRLSQEQLLSFTLFTDATHQVSECPYPEIDHLVSLLGPGPVSKRVVQNLRDGIVVSWVWKPNALYAIHNQLTKAYGAIIENLKDETKSEYDRREVLDAYFLKTKDQYVLQNILQAVDINTLGWYIVELLITDMKQSDFLIKFLDPVANGGNGAVDTKLRACRYLIELNNIGGLAHFTNSLLEMNDPSGGDHYLHALHKLTIADAIPYLMDLLKMARQPSFKKDTFNHLESDVIAGLHNIAIQSEEQLTQVRDALHKFIEDNKDSIPHLNFLHFPMERMEQEFYMNQSKSYSVSDALKEMSRLNSP